MKKRKEKYMNFWKRIKKFSPKVFNWIIVSLIVSSATIASLQILNIPVKIEEEKILMFEYIILAIFTIEFFIRFIFTKNKKEFFTNKYNIIDFISIAPFYF
jgi:hypothetical protein